MHFLLTWSDLWILTPVKPFSLNNADQYSDNSHPEFATAKSKYRHESDRSYVGTYCSLILFLIIIHGNNFDTYHHHRDRIFRIVTQLKGNNGISYTQGVPVPLAEAVKNDFPQVEESVLTSYHRDNLIAAVQSDLSIKKFEEPKGVAFTGKSFFKIFDRAIIAGPHEKLLDQSGDAVISKMWATKFYGDENVVGKVLQYDGAEYTIEAVMEDVPSNTDLPF